MRTFACFVLLSLGVCCLQAAQPIVSNVVASQRAGTKLVDITYNLSDADGDLQNVQVQVSGDAGFTYTIPATALSGHVGPGVTPGDGRTIVWNAGVDWNGQYVPLAKVRVTAHDGTTPIPPPGMVYIPAGVFQMGNNFMDGLDDELPVHQVVLDGYFIGRTEVTREMWIDVRTWGSGNGYSLTPGSNAPPGHPIGAISWYEAVRWCNARSEKEGLTPVYYLDTAHTQVYRSGNVDLANAMVKRNANGYRLPTEAEWEKAARGGILGTRFPWGNTITPNQANFFESGDPFESATIPSSPVNYYDGSQVPGGPDTANEFGLYDVIGNVLEIVWDWYSPVYYSHSSSGNSPLGPESPGTPARRVVRGGHFHVRVIPVTNAAVSSRYRMAPDGRSVDLPGNSGGFSSNGYVSTGFRCVRQP